MLAILGVEDVVGVKVAVGVKVVGKERGKVMALENLHPLKMPWMPNLMLTVQCVPCMSKDVFVVSYCFSWPCRHMMIRDQ